MLLELREEHRDKDREEGSGSLAAQRNQAEHLFFSGRGSVITCKGQVC